MQNVNSDLMYVVGNPGDELRGTLHAKRRGKGYVGLCPFCQHNSMSVGLQRQVFHCFSCGKGGLFKGAALDIMRTMFMETEDSQWPDALTVELTIPPQNNETVHLAMRICSQIADELPPPLVPFFESAELTKVTPDTIGFSFKHTQSIAFNRCSREDAIAAISEIFSRKLGRPMAIEMHLSAQETA